MDELASLHGPEVAAEPSPDAYSATPPVPRRRPNRALVVVTAAAVLAIGGGVAAAGFIKSPTERAAETGPPPRSVITASVESRRLTDTVVVRGQVTAAQTLDIAPQGAGKEGGRAVVTAVRVKPGDTLVAGQVLLEVAGRPVFVLPGDIPVYRDLKPGGEGKDVAQLQAALSGLGFSSGGDKSGAFGAGTRKAVEALYRKLGYEAPKSPDASDEQVRAARDRVIQAERAAKAAADARNAVGTNPSKQVAEDKGTPSSSPTPGRGGSDPVKAAQQQLTYANEDLARARTDLAGLEAKAGVMVPAAEVVFLGGFPARVDAVSAQVGAEVRERAVTVSAGTLVAKGQLAPHEQGLVRPGMHVRLLSEATGLAAEGTVATVADTPTDPARGGQGGGGGRCFEMTVTPSTALDPRLAGQDVRLTVEAAASDGDVLVVPVSAVSAGADGRTVVTVQEPGGGQRRVEVRPGTTGGGFVQVTPLAGLLAPGDKVVVGVSRSATSAPSKGGTR